MNKAGKAELIEELAGKLSNTDYFYIADASGLTVAEVNNFRRKCFEKGVEYKVYKNTLIKKAMDSLEGDYSAMEEALVGTSGILFSPNVGNAPAKILKEFRGAGGEKPVLKGAYIDSDVILGDENLKMLSELKSKDELIGEVIGLLQSPAKNVISALQSGKNTLAGLIKTLGEREA